MILEDVKRGFISLKEAAPRLEVGYRQAKRIYSAYRSSGDAGIVHKSRGKRSGRSYPSHFKQNVLTFYELKYAGFGPTFAAEKMAENDNIFINDETVRANDFLRKTYLAQINKKFAKKPDSSEDAHCSPKAYRDLE